MASNSQKPSSNKLYQQDIVKRIVPPYSYGIISRCWHDAEDISSQLPLADPLMRPLQHGEVGVTFISHGGEREILSESELKLVDRSMQPGDYCKHAIDDVCSGVVTGVKVKGRLEHVISGELVPGWKTVEDIEVRTEAEIGDYVLHNDWIGQVIEVFDESIVEVSTGQLVRLPELGSRLNVGEKGTDILPPPANGVHNLFGFLPGSQRQGNIDKVIAVKHTVYAVAWLALNQSLHSTATAERKRPQRFWSGIDIASLTLIRGKSDMEMRVGDRVYLKDTSALPSTEHGQEGDPAGIVHVHTFIVAETITTLDVLWQNGVQETISSMEVIPYLNPDEYDCWPGDHVLWNNEDRKRTAVVQSVNSIERTANLLFPDTNTKELVSVLELDPHGTSDMTASNPQMSADGLGVRRGDFVFVHGGGTTNGYEPPIVPRIGELEPWVREGPFNNGQFTGWRKDMSEIGNVIAGLRSSGKHESPIKRPVLGDRTLHWIGEVTGLQLDGTVEVTHPGWTVEFYPLERLTRLYDGIEQLEDELWEDDVSEEHGGYSELMEPVWAMDEEGVWQPEQGEAGEWEEAPEESPTISDEDLGVNDDMTIDLDGWNDESLIFTKASKRSRTPEISPTHAESNGTLPAPHPTGTESRNSVQLHEGIDNSGNTNFPPWARFEILPSAPTDHAFFASIPAQPSKAFLGRLTREYRVLATSLPDSILVRAYEDRTDLLRCLIIGPENTPYEDAPFVIDWMLDSNFPQSPPIAHFLSWTNGNGRVNPNLYEEGKVCLSILGTWAGDRNETWSASRSSLLQAFVSIQGLVLVKDPWFCEPAYEKLRGTEEGIVNSRLYNEKAYVLSRGFVRRALEIPLGGLEEEIERLYYGNRCLEKILRDSQALIAKSRGKVELTPEDQDLAVPRLTSGGIITLERTLRKLQVLSSYRQSKPSALHCCDLIERQN